jgi:hypothetical protein
MENYNRFCVTNGTLIRGTARLISSAENCETHTSYLLKLSSTRYQVIIESFAFQVAIKKFKDQDIQNYTFACYRVWV